MKITVPLILKKRCTAAALFAFLLVPILEMRVLKRMCKSMLADIDEFLRKKEEKKKKERKEKKKRKERKKEQNVKRH